jgi:hypothetical protein
MSDPTPAVPTPTAPPTPADTTPPTPPAGDPPKADEPLGEAGVKALQQEREARKAAEKLAAENAARIKEFEDRDKSELDKLTEGKAAAEKEAVDARREALRYRIAAKHQITDEDAETFLTGGDEDSITKQAERLVALRGEAKPSTPRPDPTQGARPGDAMDIDTQIAEATKAGNHRLAISLKRQKAYANKT